MYYSIGSNIKLGVNLHYIIITCMFSFHLFSSHPVINLTSALCGQHRTLCCQHRTVPYFDVAAICQTPGRSWWVRLPSNMNEKGMGCLASRRKGVLVFCRLARSDGSRTGACTGEKNEVTDKANIKAGLKHRQSDKCINLRCQTIKILGQT